MIKPKQKFIRLVPLTKHTSLRCHVFSHWLTREPNRNWRNREIHDKAKEFIHRMLLNSKSTYIYTHYTLLVLPFDLHWISYMMTKSVNRCDKLSTHRTQSRTRARAHLIRSYSFLIYAPSYHHFYNLAVCRQLWEILAF